jgi:YD repeat-containing protein
MTHGKLNSKTAKLTSIGLLIGLLFIVNVFGQQRQPSTGLQFANSYVTGSFDAVNVSNGNVVVNLPLASLSKERGTSPSATVTLQYNSKLWDSKQAIFSDGIQPGNGDQPTGSTYSYSTNTIEQSDRGGWKVLYEYRIQWTDRLNLESPDPCLRGDDPQKFAARWKLEMEFPDGSVRQFVPLINASVSLEGYDNIDFNGKSYSASRQTNPATGLCYMAYSSGQITTNGMNYISTDGSRLRLFIPYIAGQSPSENNLFGRNWKLYSLDGTIVENKPPDDSTVSQRTTERNGSKVEIKGNQIIDELGRSITINGNGVTMSGVNGESVTTQLVWGYRWVYRKYKKIDYGETVPTGTERWAWLGEQIQTLDQIILPTQAGGQFYTFDYYGDATQQSGTNYTNGWGELKSVTLPTGAKTTYTFESAIGTDALASDVLGNKAISKDLVYNDEGNVIRTETTLFTSSQGYGSSVTMPNGAVSGEQTFYSSYAAWNNGLAFKSVSPDGSFIEKIWKQNLPNSSFINPTSGSGNANAYIKTDFTTITNSAGQPYLTAIHDYNYDKNGNVTRIAEYDWVAYGTIPRDPSGRPNGIPAGAVLKRITNNEYYNQTPDADSTVTSPYTFENPSSPKLKNVIKSTEVQNAAGTPVSRSEFFYDDANNKGNLIETRTWDSKKGGSSQAYSNPLTTSNSISAFVQYDNYGNPTLTTDAKSNQTQITYGSINGYTGLYPTEVKSAYNTTIQQTVQSEYDFYTGLPKRVTALGNTAAENVVSETEYDALGRPIKTKAAVGTPSEIWTTTEYNDVLRRVISRSDIETKGDGKRIAIQHFDQLGRVRLTRRIENILTENPYNESDGIKVQTRYLTGNPDSYQLTSNPYRAATSATATAEESMGWTRSKAVNTGRHSEVETFTGATLPAPWGTNANSTGKVQTDIDAERTLVTDQAGKQRISKTNALGQLLNVWEVKTADTDTEAISFGALSLNGLKTSYQYDTLNNLTTVNQGGQTRNFSYSSLSRLLSATNPESGLIQYNYDNNGNLTSKIDARNITTSYVYDNLNRVKTRSYSDTTPAVGYFYDNLTNAKGKLIKVSSSVSTTEYSSFDSFGRLLAHRQTTDGQTYNSSYSYNLSGALIEETYPSGRVVRNTLNNDGNLSQVQSKKANDTFRNYANSFNYTAAGAVSSMRLGNGKWENTQFNSRLQPTQIGLGSSATNQGLLKLNFDYGSTDNNGNVKSQQITTPTVGNVAGFTATQTYTYDSLNRLKDAKEMIGANQQWKQTFTYDRFGNRNFDTANNNTTMV